MARPTKYDPSLIDQIPEYLKTVGREQTTLPTKYGFAKFIDVDTDTLVEWVKEHEEFSVAIKELERTQQEQLMNDGLYGGKEVNSTMAIFLLKANHGLIETDRHLVETKGSLIDIDDDGKSNVHTVSPVPAQTN